MTLADIDITVRSEGDHHRLPEKPLRFGFIPIPPASPLADRQEKLALGAEFHHGGAIRGGNPDIVRGIDGHPVRLVLVAGHVLADLKDQVVIQIELEQLRFPGESRATAGTPPKPGGSTYGYVNVYPIVCCHCTRCNDWRARPSRLPQTGDRLHAGVSPTAGAGGAAAAALPAAPRPSPPLRAGTVTCPLGSTIVRPVGSGNDPCRNQAGVPPTAGPTVGG